MARFLIVVTFLEGEFAGRQMEEGVLMRVYEDALRITTQWSDQLWYLSKSVDYAESQSCLSCRRER
jgi:hypothetical protein